jgi:uncharacterized protein YnzC (UPF0291/DUF896 family)
MITPEMISRINELARKQREGTLSDAELSEQAELRRAYIDVMKARVKEQLGAVGAPAHHHGCGCGCQHKHH